MTRTDQMVPLDTKWYINPKKNVDDEVERYKTRMVACDNEQSHGENYTITFATVMGMTTGKVTLALSGLWGVPAKHSDGLNAYVKAPTEPDVNILRSARSDCGKKELHRLGIQQAGEVFL